MNNYNKTILQHITGFVIGGMLGMILVTLLGGEFSAQGIITIIGIIGGYMVRVYLVPSKKDNPENSINMEKDNIPTRLTFDGRAIKYSNLEHQHLSNIYWFNTILHGHEHDHDKALLLELDNRFKGEMLSYKPLKGFPAEIFLLKKRGLVEKKDGREAIYFNGKEVGEII